MIQWLTFTHTNPDGKTVAVAGPRSLVHVGEGVCIGDDVILDEGATIEVGAYLGDRVVVGLDAIVGVGAIVGADCQIDKHAWVADGVVVLPGTWVKAEI